jgi:hypothetical protein
LVANPGPTLAANIAALKTNALNQRTTPLPIFTPHT